MDHEKRVGAPAPVSPQAPGRFDYVQYDDHTAAIQLGFKVTFENLATAIESLPRGRAQALALTKLEEAYMWVGKTLRDEQIQRNGSAPLQERRG